MAESVLVIVGEWECSPEGRWNFVVEKDVMAQSVLLKPDMDYKALQKQIEEEFELAGSGLEANLSFWMPSEMSIFSSSRAPPVCVKSDTGIQTFRQVRSQNKCLNLFVSFGSAGRFEQSLPSLEQKDATQQVHGGPSKSDASGGGNTNAVKHGKGKQYTEVGGCSRLNWDDGIIRLGDDTPSDGEGIYPTAKGDGHLLGYSERAEHNSMPVDVALQLGNEDDTAKYLNNSPASNHIECQFESGVGKLNWNDSIPHLRDEPSPYAEPDNPTSFQKIDIQKDAQPMENSEAESENESRGHSMEYVRTRKKGSGTSGGIQRCLQFSSESSEDDDCFELENLSDSDDEHDKDPTDEQLTLHGRRTRDSTQLEDGQLNRSESGDAVVPDLNRYDSNDSIVPVITHNQIDRDTIQLFDVDDTAEDDVAGNIGGIHSGTFAVTAVSRPGYMGTDIQAGNLRDLQSQTFGGTGGPQSLEVVSAPESAITLGLNVQTYHEAASQTFHMETVHQAGNSLQIATGHQSDMPGQLQLATGAETLTAGVLGTAAAGHRSNQFEVGSGSNQNQLDVYQFNCSLSNIYDDIRDGNMLPETDAPPVLDEAVLISGETGPGEPDETEDDICIGREFKDKDEMHHVISLHAIKNVYNFRTEKSDTTRLILRCADRNCKWRVFGATMGGQSQNIKIRTARLEHTCDVTTRAGYGKRATSKVIAGVLKRRYVNGQEGPRAVDIPDIVLAELKVSITYMKGWYAKERAVASCRGSEEASYNLLAGYLQLLVKANPGTVYTLETGIGKKGETRFKYLFFSLGASIAAIPYLRKVLIIDGTTMKGKFKGCLLTASYQDGNFQVFPLAFGVVDGENDLSWTWFFTQLQQIVPDSRDLVFVSDRHSSIYSSLSKVYPLAYHGACSVHLVRNVKKHFKGKGLAFLVSKAATVYSVAEFRYWFGEIQRRNRECADYLLSIGLTHWTQVYSPGMRYNISSTNIAETLNAALAKALRLPIVSLVETIRMMLMQWFCWRRANAAKQTTTLTAEVEKLIMIHLKDSAGYAAIAASEWIYQVYSDKGVSFTVDLEKRSCSCKLYDKVLIPCSHALAAARAAGIGINRMADCVYQVAYVQKVYAGIVMPVPNVEDEELPKQEPENAVFPPGAPRGSGRPRKRRIRSEDEPAPKKSRAGQTKCSRCGCPGHNKTTCQNPLN